MRIEITTTGDGVTVAAIETNVSMTSEVVIARGNTLTEALENLMVRFSELRVAALKELRDKAFIRSVTESENLS